MSAAQEPESYIRPYNAKDYDQVVDILQQNDSFYSRDHKETSFAAAQKEWGEESVLVHIRSELGKRAVMGIVRVTFMTPDQHKALIGDLMVSPTVQNKGTGTRLLEALENVLYARGCLPELLTNAPPLPYAIGAQNSYGFTETAVSEMRILP